MPTDKPLQALGGRPAPAEIERDIELFLALPTPAKTHFWQLLGPSLVDPLPDTLEADLDAFCQAHGVRGAELARAVRACRFLVWQASCRDLPRERFAEDLASLSPSPELGSVLLAGYEAGKAQVRNELLRGALLDHGNVLDAVDWRVDRVTTSSRGGALEATVGVLTLRYRAGGKDERLTVQLVPEALRELHQACERLAEAAKRGG
jgi:hypothetical protein